MTKREAEKAGKALLKRLKGRGWKLEVWENIGWCYCCRLGPITVTPTSAGKFFCFMSSDPDGAGGSLLWYIDEKYKGPNRLVQRQIKVARAKVKQLDALVKKCEEALKCQKRLGRSPTAGAAAAGGSRAGSTSSPAGSLNRVFSCQ